MAAKAAEERRTAIRTAGKHLFMAGILKHSAISIQPRQLTAKGAKDAKGEKISRISYAHFAPVAVLWFG
jgi:hypothetical protein